MRRLDLSFDNPAENLALDETLLNEAEAGRSGETLRFWEGRSPFVVLGLTQSLADHVFEDACLRDGVPILRRCSAGGCVLQGPGCLNFSLVLRTDRPECGTIRASYRTILDRIALGLKDLAGVNAYPAGISDIAVYGRKISGNAQRRRRQFFLHHGTLLYQLDTAACAAYLREPADRPDYRQARTHQQFMTALPLKPDMLKQVVSGVFQEARPGAVSSSELASVKELVKTKYTVDAWHRRK